MADCPLTARLSRPTGKAGALATILCRSPRLSRSAPCFAARRSPLACRSNAFAARGAVAAPHDLAARRSLAVRTPSPLAARLPLHTTLPLAVRALIVTAAARRREGFEALSIAQRLETIASWVSTLGGATDAAVAQPGVDHGARHDHVAAVEQVTAAHQLLNAR